MPVSLRYCCCWFDRFAWSVSPLFVELMLFLRFLRYYVAVCLSLTVLRALIAVGRMVRAVQRVRAAGKGSLLLVDRRFLGASVPLLLGYFGCAAILLAWSSVVCPSVVP